MKKPKLNILKIGGNLIEEDEKLRETLEFFTSLQDPKCLVHGGGRHASRLSRQMGIEPRVVEGRRITDDAALEVVTMVYAGLFNKKIISWLQAIGCDAIGLSGADANSIRAHKRPVGSIDYGWAGDIDTINAGKIKELLRISLTPVFCAITHDGHGQLLNTNADTIASRLAIALAPDFEVTLYFCFEGKGVLGNPDDKNSVLAELSLAGYQRSRQKGIISAGMIPKLDNAFQALKEKVAGVVVGNPKTIAQKKATYLRIRKK